VDAPVVIYDPINIAVAGGGGTAKASQSNTVEINQSAVQVAGVGGNGGNGNAAISGELTMLGSASPLGYWQMIQGGGNQAGNGGDGYFHGSLVHTSVALYDPVNRRGGGISFQYECRPDQQREFGSILLTDGRRGR